MYMLHMDRPNYCNNYVYFEYWNFSVSLSQYKATHCLESDKYKAEKHEHCLLEYLFSHYHNNNISYGMFS